MTAAAILSFSFSGDMYFLILRNKKRRARVFF